MGETEPISLPNWRDFAICKGVDPNFMVPSGDMEEKLAVVVCSSCTVVMPCLIEALTNNEVGVWGGTTTLERKQIRRNMR